MPPHMNDSQQRREKRVRRRLEERTARIGNREYTRVDALEIAIDVFGRIMRRWSTREKDLVKFARFNWNWQEATMVDAGLAAEWTVREYLDHLGKLQGALTTILIIEGGLDAMNQKGSPEYTARNLVYRLFSNLLPEHLLCSGIEKIAVNAALHGTVERTDPRVERIQEDLQRLNYGVGQEEAQELQDKVAEIIAQAVLSDGSRTEDKATKVVRLLRLIQRAGAPAAPGAQPAPGVVSPGAAAPASPSASASAVQAAVLNVTVAIRTATDAEQKQIYEAMKTEADSQGFLDAAERILASTYDSYETSNVLQEFNGSTANGLDTGGAVQPHVTESPVAALLGIPAVIWEIRSMIKKVKEKGIKALDPIATAGTATHVVSQAGQTVASANLISKAVGAATLEAFQVGAVNAATVASLGTTGVGVIGGLIQIASGARQIYGAAQIGSRWDALSSQEKTEVTNDPSLTFFATQIVTTKLRNRKIRGVVDIIGGVAGVVSGTIGCLLLASVVVAAIPIVGWVAAGIGFACALGMGAYKVGRYFFNKSKLQEAVDNGIIHRQFPPYIKTIGGYYRWEVADKLLAWAKDANRRLDDIVAKVARVLFGVLDPTEDILALDLAGLIGFMADG